MFGLFAKQTTLVEVNNGVEDQHGVLVARDPNGEVVEVGFRAERPEALRDADAHVIMNVFEQFGRKGYIPRYIEVAGKRHEAPAAARKLEALMYS